MPRYDVATLNPWMSLHPYLTVERRIPEQNLIDLSIGYDPAEDLDALKLMWVERVAAQGDGLYGR